jgi:dihydroxyacetone kinase-like protein
MIDMDPPTTISLLRRLCETVAAHEQELTRLDQAIGDGDHGINMRRGFDAALAELDNAAGKSLPELLKAVGTALVMKVGGASGPLYGTLFLALAKELTPTPDRQSAVRAFAAAIAAVKARGRSDTGQKTMLDVLVPVHEALAAGADAARVKAVAAAAADATIAMRALRGRASFLGERSIGHMDPGARSSALLIAAAADVLEGA